MGFEDVREQLQRMIKRVDGLNSIVFTDRDGVPVVKVSRNSQDQGFGFAKAEQMACSIASLTQAGRLQMGRPKYVISCKDSSQLICFNENQVFVHLFASSAATTGMLLCLEKELTALASDLSRVIDNS
ncbi:ragulator complex protein LAMTOR3 isoform X2 [Galendromus occidentalis]|uniref:Ragulator complex protein LAMTOR3 isoform X2 n=1 Tax=Galendromus occidentalis TaxID=34638 RepID=A0AAJ6QVX7_9ACAR|nr:ragulator complex protein LAMTOR3 isoform X2 [Galendromus occidentalis]